MAIRKNPITEGSYYHIMARGVNKQQIFFDQRDYARFLFYIIFYQSPLRIYNTNYYISRFIKTGNFPITKKTIQKIINHRYSKLINFSFMPNHIHLTLYELERGGISKTMQRSLDGFSRYIHTKYKRSGHVFEGPFKAIHIKDNTQLLHLSTYIHKNPKELKKWQKNWEQYPWSSHQDYVGNNRWGDLLSRDIILEQFKKPKEYTYFVKTSTAKEAKEKLDNSIFLNL